MKAFPIVTCFLVAHPCAAVYLEPSYMCDQMLDPDEWFSTASDEDCASAALEAEAELVRRVPGHFSMKDQPAVRALAKLELERKLIDLAADPSR